MSIVKDFTGSLFHRILLWALMVFALAPVYDVSGENTEPETLSVKWYRPTGWESTSGRAEKAAQAVFFEKHPHVRLKSWSSLKLPGGMFQQADLLAFAGGVAADVQPLFIHQLQFFAQQGLLCPLDAYLFKSDPAGDEWEAWKTFPQSFRDVGTFEGKVYGLPSGCYVSSFVFRRDVFESEGLDPDQSVESLEDFWKLCQKLTTRQSDRSGSAKADRYAFSVSELESSYLTFFLAYKTNIVEIDWLDANGEIRATSVLGETPPPQAEQEKWLPRKRLACDSPQARAALAAMWKFRWGPWVKDPVTGNIRDVTESEAATLTDVQRGVVYSDVRQDKTDSLGRLWRGQTAFSYVTLQSRNELFESNNIGLLPFPPLHKGDSSPAPLLPVMLALNRQLTTRPRLMQAGWDWISFQAGSESSRLQNQVFMDSGRVRSISLWELRRSGMESLIQLQDKRLIAPQEYLYNGKNTVPYFNGWIAVDQHILNSVVRPMLSDPNFDYKAALAEVVRMSNEKVLGNISQEVKQQRSIGAFVAVVLTALAMITGSISVIKRQALQAKASTFVEINISGAKQRANLFYSIILLGPALVLLALFSYYPIGRGVVMAFQDFRLSGEYIFNGLDNFSEALFASHFWISVLNTLVFVALNLSIGFFAPIILALLLSEVPWGTSIFRTIYYLPAVTAGLVVSLLWMRLYLPGSDGMLNQFMSPLISYWNSTMPAALNIEYPVNWLGNPNLAMLCVIIPTIWASAGPGSLIYLAALKSIPDEIYEAADLDGCSVFQKLRHITLPALFPLLLINFVAAFIGAFQSMGNIFVMTGGGPNFATHVLSLEVWQNAFLYLRFGVATAQAWMLGATLIGFIVIQMRILEKMDWRKPQS